jgi:hypothetical protein
MRMQGSDERMGNPDKASVCGCGKCGLDGDMEIEVDLQDGELAGFQGKNWEQGEADNKARQCSKVTASKNEKSIPSAHCS